MQEYAVPCHARDAYENEILQWQRNGWLLPYSEEELGPPKGLILNGGRAGAEAEGASCA